MPLLDRGGHDRGFVLLDLLIGALILGILAMAAIPLFSSMIAESRLNGAAGEMVSAVQYAESLTARYQRPFGLDVDGPNNTFYVYDSAPTGDPAVNGNNVVVNPLDKSWYIRAFDSMDEYRGAKISSPAAAVSVLFYPDGHSSLSGSSFTIDYAGLQRTITVDGGTGRTTVQ